MIEDQASYREAVAQLQSASAAYYGDGSQQLSDYDYDQLWDQIAIVEATHPEWVEGTPITAQVAGGAVGGDVAHSRPMLSLENTYSPEEIGAWVAKTAAKVPDTLFVVEPKLDGAALNITYRDGELVQITKRGDGTSGEDVTFADHLIANLAHSGVTWPDGTPFTAELRGEAIFTRGQYAEANRLREENRDQPFKNARNGLAGTISGAAGRDYAIRFCFVVYDVVSDYLDANLDYTEQLALVAQCQFDTSVGLSSGPVPAAQVAAEVARWESERHNLRFETDGAVVKITGNADRQALGSSSRAPRWAVAYKFAPDQVTSKLIAVTWEMGRTGLITPRAEIEPVEVGGTTITYTTLHNPADIERKGFLLGDTVLVQRAGEVIPRLEAPVVEARTGAETPIVPPAVCPRCGGPIDRSGERWRCAQGRVCGMAEAIAYAASRDALDIEGLGKVQVTKLVEAGVINDLRDLFLLTAGDLIRYGGVAPANAPKIMAQIERATKASPAKVITALGIRLTGRSMSRRLARKFGTLSNFAAATIDELAAVDKIGDVKAATIRAELDDLGMVIGFLIGQGIGETSEAAGPARGAEPGEGVQAAPLAGKTVVVTGSMTDALAGKSRNEVNEMIELLGGKSSSSVSKNTSLLVVGENAGSKLAKATELGVPVLTEAEFAVLAGLA